MSTRNLLDEVAQRLAQAIKTVDNELDAEWSDSKATTFKEMSQALYHLEKAGDLIDWLTWNGYVA